MEANNELIKENYIIIGDSLPYGVGDYENNGWVALFKNDLMAQDKNSKRVSNYEHSATYPGVTSRFIAGKIDSILDAFVSTDKNVENHVILSFGVNDTKIVNGKVQIDLSEFMVNYVNIIQKVKERKCSIIVLGLTRTAPAERLEFKEGQFFINDVINMYDQKLQNICELYNVPYIKMSDVLEPDQYHDGIHPDTDGHKKIFRKVLPEIIN